MRTRARPLRDAASLLIYAVTCADSVHSRRLHGSTALGLAGGPLVARLQVPANALVQQRSEASGENQPANPSHPTGLGNTIIPLAALLSTTPLLASPNRVSRHPPRRRSFPRRRALTIHAPCEYILTAPRPETVIVVVPCRRISPDPDARPQTPLSRHRSSWPGVRTVERPIGDNSIRVAQRDKCA
jgi:hypothetical protein